MTTTTTFTKGEKVAEKKPIYGIWVKPDINSLIGKIAGKYPVKEFNMFQIYPKECKLLLFFKAKGGGVRIFSYDCKTDILKEQG